MRKGICLSLLERLFVYGIPLVLLILAIFFDLPLSQAVYSKGNGLGVAFEIIAPMFPYGLGVFSAALLFRFCPRPKKMALSVLVSIAIVIAALGIAFYGGNHVASYVARALGMGKPWWLSAVYGVAFALLFSVPAFFVPQTNPRGVLVFVIMFAILFVTILVLYQGIKLLWLRPRWRTLVALQQSGAIDSATNAWIPFYQPQGFWNFNSLYVDPISESQRIIAMNSLGIVSWGTEEFVSFPSGHVINVTALTSLSMMSLFMPKLRGKERFVRFGVYALAALVAFTRILCGAHYLSDVAFGFAFSVLVYDLYSTFLLPVIAAKFLPMPVLPNDEATES